MIKEDENVQKDLIDAILERPYCFELNGNHFNLYPATLGKTLLVAPLIESLKMNLNRLDRNPYNEALRTTKKKKSIVLNIIAYHTIEKKKDIFDIECLKDRMNKLESADDESLATLLILCITKDHLYEKFEKFTGMDKQKRRKEKVLAIKKSNNTFIFGGSSLYGSLIDAACERYGWSYEYVVWEISYINLRMILSDQITSIYLTDKEARSVHISNDNVVINADDPKNKQRIKEILKG